MHHLGFFESSNQEEPNLFVNASKFVLHRATRKKRAKHEKIRERNDDIAVARNENMGRREVEQKIEKK